MITIMFSNRRSTMSSKPAVLVTGASSGIGAVYADRFAHRGHDLVLVARDAERLNGLAERLRREAGVTVDVVQADLTRTEDLARVEARLREDARIGVLVNNAGAALSGPFAEQSPDQTAALIGLNVTALTRLAGAVAPRFAAAGTGAIINIGSVVGFVPEFGITRAARSSPARAMEILARAGVGNLPEPGDELPADLVPRDVRP